MTRLYLILIVYIFTFINISIAQTSPFNQFPEWVSTDISNRATGLGVADINQDGWNDIIVANGNDMNRQKVVVYYNDGTGSFPLTPSWSSSDIDYHGHLSIGDVNGDNLPDVAVSVFLGPARFTEPGYVKVYYNQGYELENIPSYQTADSMFTFSCALGDADGDGDLDLAVACGEPYSGHFAKGKIYYNIEGSLQTLPGWESQVSMGAMDVDFADMDKNGYLDLVFACHVTPNYIFLADSAGSISTTPSWSSGDMNYFANSLTIAEIDSNKYLDLVISDNSQLGGQGKYKSYLFSSAPSGQSSPNWLSNSGGYGSAVLMEDLNFDNHVDLLAGRWWGSVDFYSGISGSFSMNPTWLSSTNSVIEAYVLKDVDRDGIYQNTETVNITLDSIHVIYLQDKTIEKIISVELNGTALNPGSDYNFNSEIKWITFAPTLNSRDQIIIEYEYSRDRDLIVSNWDSSIGNYLFYNQTNPTSIRTTSVQNNENIVSISPNPFNNTCRINIYSPQVNNLEITIFDIRGRLVKRLVNQEILPGSHHFIWNANDDKGITVSTGTYLYLINLGNKTFTGKLLLFQ